jgi:hypothetical protein
LFHEVARLQLLEALKQLAHNSQGQMLPVLPDEKELQHLHDEFFRRFLFQ